jgi:hypothetical protein
LFQSLSTSLRAEQGWGFPSCECTRAGGAVLVRERPKNGFKVRGAKMLAADVLTEEDIMGIKWKLIRLGSRGSSHVLRI